MPWQACACRPGPRRGADERALPVPLAMSAATTPVVSPLQLQEETAATQRAAGVGGAAASRQGAGGQVRVTAAAVRVAVGGEALSGRQWGETAMPGPAKKAATARRAGE